MTTTYLIKSTLVRFFFSLLLAVLFLAPGLQAQSRYASQGQASGTIKVSGTSDLQDWSLASTAAETQGLFVLDENQQLLAISSLTFVVRAETLKSGLKPMDKKAQKALKASKYPNIRFALHRAEVVPGQPNQYLIIAKGGLTIKGVTQTVLLEMAAKVNPDGSILIQGAKDLTFSDFNIKRPSFMGGVMQAGNNINVAIALTYKPETQVSLYQK